MSIREKGKVRASGMKKEGSARLKFGELFKIFTKINSTQESITDT
jgi:hypothetical protein